MRCFAGSLLVVLLVAGARPAAAQSPPLGEYVAEGSCPGQNGVYRGVLRIEANGPLFRLAWKIGPDTYFGTAIEQGGQLAIDYVSGGTRGIMHARPDGEGGYLGAWSSYGTNAICQERWTRR